MIAIRLIVRKIWAAKWVKWVALAILGCMINEFYRFSPYLAYPLQRLAEWQPKNPLQSWIDLILLGFIYISALMAVWSILAEWLGPKSKAAAIPFEQQFDEMLESLSDPDISHDVIRDRIERLYDALLDQIGLLFKVPRREIRAVLIHYDGNLKKLESWRWGRNTTPEQDRIDLKAIEILFDQGLTYPVWEDVKEQFPNGDSDTLLLIRNRGNLRLGLLIAISRRVEMKPLMAEYAKLVYPFTMLGHMDKLVDFVLNYKQGG